LTKSGKRRAHALDERVVPVLRAVDFGDDADTTAAVCGQLAGAYWGESGIPAEWREALARRDMIEKALQGLLRIWLNPCAATTWRR